MSYIKSIRYNAVVYSLYMYRCTAKICISVLTEGGGAALCSSLIRIRMLPHTHTHALR